MTERSVMFWKSPMMKKIGLIIFLMIIAASVFIFIAAFHQTNALLMNSAEHETLASASTAAGLINGNLMERIDTGDENSAEYRTIQDLLNQIRRSNPDLKYLYTMRRSNGTLVFVVDADYQNPAAVIPGASIGEPYPNATAAMNSAFYGAVTEPDFVTDAWGTVFSAYAPIFNSRGEVVGIVGADIDAGLLSSKLMTIKILYLAVLLITFLFAIAVAVFTASLQEDTLATLREHKEYLATIMNSVPAGMLIIDAKTHRITDINPAALAMIGAGREIVVGQVCHTFICPAETGRCPITDLGKSVDNAERILIDISGKKIPVIKSVRRVTLGGQEMLVESFVDITDRKKMEEQNARLIKELESANTELKDFAYVVSHDLKAPLRAIGSLSQWLYTDYRDKFDDEGKASLDLIVNRVNRMQGLIDGILEYSRVGRVHEQKDSIDLDIMVREVIDSLGIPPHITVTIDERLPVVVYEKTRIRQVFANLIGNAVKYIDKPAGEVHIGCTQEGAFWKFSVRDNGPGIDARYYEKIFQIFQTLHPRDQVESTGIGLSIVKRIVEMNGGKIWVESIVGRGSVFYVTVPISRTTEQDTS